MHAAVDTIAKGMQKEAKAMQPNQNTNIQTATPNCSKPINSCPFLFLALFLFVVAVCPPSKVAVEQNHETKRGVGGEGPTLCCIIMHEAFGEREKNGWHGATTHCF
jgi:hypothetical protein